MMRLNNPQYSFEKTLNECIAGITGNPALQQKIRSSNHDFTAVETQYINAARTGKLYDISPINTDGDTDPIIISTLKKSELLKIYDHYFVPKQKPARKIYEALLNAAKEKCPFCGGIGTARNLDHFLPKAHFPQFSILPHNLVPACRDCNMDGKSNDFATSAENQIIQPYVDNERFFSEQWVFAKYHAGNNSEPGFFEYFTSPPTSWSCIDKQRVIKHFKNFNLARRYAVKAAELLGTVLLQINNMKQYGLDSLSIQNTLLQPGIDTAPFANHWLKGMYQALTSEVLKK
jgi:hypothetical protein